MSPNEEKDRITIVIRMSNCDLQFIHEYKSSSNEILNVI
jgi:hypothetical protein